MGEDVDFHIRLDYRHLDVERRDLIGQAVAVPFNRPLGCTIHAQSGRPKVAGDCRHQYYMAILLAPKDRQSRLDYVDRSEEVGLLNQ